MSTFKKLAGQTAIYGLSSILGRFFNYLLVPIYTRVFDTGEYGIVTQLYAYVSFLNILFTYGLETGFFRFYQSRNGDSKVYSTSLWSIIFTSSALCILIVSFSGPIATAIGNGVANMLPKYIGWFAGILAFDAITAIPFARLRQENKAKRFAFIRLTNIFVNIVFNVFFLIICPKLIAHGYTFVNSIYDPTMGVGYVFLSNLIASAVTILMLFPEIFRVSFNFDKRLWKEMLFYSFPLMIAGFAGTINETFDRILLPMLIPNKTEAIAQNGIYGACYKLSILMTLFIQTFRYAAEPFFFSHSTKKDPQKVYAQVMNWFVLICAFIFLGVMLYIDVVKHFIGESFRVGLKIVPILLMANLCIGVYYNLSIWYKLTGKTRWGAWMSLIGAAVTLLFNFMLIPRMGYMGAAWTTLICYAFMMIICYLIGQKYYPVPYDLFRFFGYIGIALGLWGVSLLVKTFAGLSGTPFMVFNTVLLLIFPALAWLFERRKNSTFAS